MKSIYYLIDKVDRDIKNDDDKTALELLTPYKKMELKNYIEENNLDIPIEISKEDVKKINNKKRV